MKNRIAVFGGSMFEDVVYTDGKYSIKKNGYLKMLNALYDVNNYSYKGLTLSKSKKILKNALLENKFDMCIISLSENEDCPLDEFIYNLDNMLSNLKDNEVKVILISNPNSNAIYNSQMRRLADLYDFEFINSLVNEEVNAPIGELVLA